MWSKYPKLAEDTVEHLGLGVEIIPPSGQQRCMRRRLVRDLMTQIGKRTHDWVVPPAAVFASKTDHQRLHLR